MTLRLAETALEVWPELDGWALAQGITPDLRDLPLDRFENLVWWFMIRNCGSDEEMAKIKADLWRPPKGTRVTEGPWSPEAETAAFRAVQRQIGSRKSEGPQQ